MLQTVLASLRCPLCATPFTAIDRTLRCAEGHAFDVAGEGYVNLLVGHVTPGTADTSEMVRARQAFLTTGHFRPLAETIAREAARRDLPPGLIVDAGAGTAYYLAAVLEARPGAHGLALDISKAAIRRAARVHGRANAVVCDVWKRLPLADHAAALMLNIFAPRHGAEYRRVLHPEGALLVATPTARHLQELVAPLGLLRVDAAKEDRLGRALDQHFSRASETILERSVTLSAAEARLVAAMGPAAHHVTPEALDGRVAALPESIAVTMSVRLTTHRPR